MGLFIFFLNFGPMADSSFSYVFFYNHVKSRAFFLKPVAWKPKCPPKYLRVHQGVFFLMKFIKTSDFRSDKKESFYNDMLQ